ncbi:WYL domain-containing protein [Aliarcobacter cryaerophilus]|uniref:WYL domain-containing protein n=1 Tax=Aliarcobacter cryaerophilus TaxID=28198 RepID=UPI0021B331CE|nr:WYL domain-containing protein [Aliarcobacter cryaerophilus]MCT7464898.1 WYL domain-containing protein [Aliarcobacter cryaerophilus]
MAELSTLKKYKIIIEEFDKREDKCLTGYDEILINKLSLGPKQIDRLIKELSIEFDNIVEIGNKKKKTYKLIKPIDLFVEAFDKSEEIGWLFNMANDADPNIFKQLEKYTNQNKTIYKFQNSPFEDIQTLEQKKIFQILKRAIKNREYIKIKYKSVEQEFDNLKCLKLIFIDNNWYTAIIDTNSKLRLIRISFIENVSYATKVESYQKSTIKDELEFINNRLQNAMSLYNKEVKIATLKATPQISKYFEKNMKKFLPTQEFKEKLDDGSIIFTVKYTQPLEILPFIQKWLPDLIIQAPNELKETYKIKLLQAVKFYNIN